MSEAHNEKSKVLIVDDVSENLRIMMNILGDHYAIVAARSGEKALRLAADKPQPEVILLDIMMPDMDGYEVLRRLKADPATADIPVIFVTALSEATDEAKGLKLGVADYITKPVNPDLLRKRVMAQIELRRYHRKASAFDMVDGGAASTPLSILVVDDAPENIGCLVSALSDEYRIIEANTGQMAIELVQGANPPDLILLDVLMPEMDGYETCRRIKATAAGYRIPVIFLSVLEEAAEKVRGFSLGAADFITKPFDIDETRARIRTHLQLSRLQLYFEQQVEQRTAALTASTSQLRATLEAIPDLLFELDRTGCFQGVHTPRLRQEFLETPQEQLIGKLISEVLPPDAAAAFLTALQEANESGWSNGKEFAWPLAQGSCWFELSVAKKQVAAAQDVRFIVLARDITERKRKEAESMKLQALLNQAQKMEAIGVLAGGIAHDFNNILGIILGYAEMARDDSPPDSEMGKQLEWVLTAAYRAKDLVKQILAFSRQSNVERIAMKIQPLVKEALKMLRSSIPSTITIAEDIDPQCGVVLADPTQIHQIVMNLCTNSYHAMERTGGLLSITLKTTVVDSPTVGYGGHVAPGEYVELLISDTGTGIGPDIIDKIFDPYFTTKEVAKGTGLGLAITHGIIKSYGGAIMVESTLGQGTTFHLYFPMVHEEARDSEQPQETLGGKERILFVDDEEAIVEMGRDMLERLGYTVTAHNRGIAALDAFLNRPDQFDLVITDQTMPAMTGIDLAQRLLSIRPEIPIILCTGFSYLINEESAKALGVRGFALKPLTKSSLGQLIRKVLDGERVE